MIVGQILIVHCVIAWHYRVDGYLFLITVFLFVTLMHIGNTSRNGLLLKWPLAEHSLFRLLFSSSTDHKTIKMKATLWRAIYFYCFLLFTGFLGYVNQFSIGKLLDKRSPFESFSSYCACTLVVTPSLRSLIFFCSILLLNALWLINCFHYDLGQVSLFSQPLKFLSKTVCLWLDLLWSLSVLL